MERILLVLLVILSLVVVILACILGAKSPPSSSPVFVGPSDGHFVDNGSEDKEDEKTTKKGKWISYLKIAFSFLMNFPRQVIKLRE